jgi:hypothetical protein
MAPPLRQPVAPLHPDGTWSADITTSTLSDWLYMGRLLATNNIFQFTDTNLPDFN